MTFVEEIQSALTAAGFDTDGVDGAWGPKTSAAAAFYQSSKGLPVTGLPEPALAHALGVAIPPLPSSLASLPAALASHLPGIATSVMGAVKLMLHESGMNPQLIPGSPAVGIFELLVTLVQSVTGMTPQQFGNLSAAQQVPYAARFWRAKGLKLPVSPRDLYWVNYLPDAYVEGAPDSYAFVWKDDTFQSKSRGARVPYHGVYTQNENLDHPLPGTTSRKGYVTAGDMAIALDDGATGSPSLYAALADALAGIGVT
jgi:hypothetical protein